MIYSTKNQHQGPSCPVHYVTVTKESNGTLKVESKLKHSSTPEPPRYFHHPNRFADYQNFWNNLVNNVNGFSDCKNPLENDPEYLQFLNSQGQGLGQGLGQDGLYYQGSNKCITESRINWTYIKSFFTWTLLFNNLFLFGLIFIGMTVIPQKDHVPVLTRRILISLGVCILYSFIGLITGGLSALGNRLCNCNCDGNNQSY